MPESSAYTPDSVHVPVRDTERKKERDFDF